jgi:hypothetical protein
MAFFNGKYESEKPEQVIPAPTQDLTKLVRRLPDVLPEYFEELESMLPGDPHRNLETILRKEISLNVVFLGLICITLYVAFQSELSWEMKELVELASIPGGLIFFPALLHTLTPRKVDEQKILEFQETVKTALALGDPILQVNELSFLEKLFLQRLFPRDPYQDENMMIKKY